MWIVHGLPCAVFGVLKRWEVLNLVRVCLGIVHVCLRRKGTTPGTVIHTITNGVALLLLLAGVLGSIG
jgi:hypothetical protein